MRLVLIDGTWANRHESGFTDASPLVQALRALGYDIAPEPERFTWSDSVDGVIGPDRTWDDAGDKLRLWARLHPVDGAVTHSHGWQVLAKACAHGLSLHRVVAIAAPVRPELAEVYAQAKTRIGALLGVRSGVFDVWQWLGSLPEIIAGQLPERLAQARAARLAWPAVTRDLPEADRTIVVDGLTPWTLTDPPHHQLLAPGVLQRAGVFTWLRG